MGIVGFLKTGDDGARLTYYERWMMWNKNTNRWHVYRSGSMGLGVLIIETKDEEEAVGKLVY